MNKLESFNRKYLKLLVLHIDRIRVTVAGASRCPPGKELWACPPSLQERLHLWFDLGMPQNFLREAGGSSERGKSGRLSSNSCSALYGRKKMNARTSKLFNTIILLCLSLTFTAELSNHFCDSFS